MERETSHIPTVSYPLSLCNAPGGLTFPLPGEQGTPEIFQGISHERQGQSLALTVLNVPCSLGSERGATWLGVGRPYLDSEMGKRSSVDGALPG